MGNRLQESGSGGGAEHLVREFARSTSAHGVAHIESHRGGPVARAAWSLLCLTSLVWVTWQAKLLVQKYLSYPTQVNVQIDYGQLDFPSVTICNKNPLRKSSLEPKINSTLDDKFWAKFDEDEDEDEDEDGSNSSGTREGSGGSGSGDRMVRQVPDDYYYYESSLNKETEIHATFCADPALRLSYSATEFCFMCPENKECLSGTNFTAMDETSKLARFWGLVYQTVNSSERSLFGYQKIDFIQECKWKGQTCNIATEFYQQNYPVYGNCFTFNHAASSGGRRVKNSSLTGHQFGFTATAWLDQEQYISQLAHSAGARVVIHEPGTQPYPSEEGFDVPPGYETSIGVRVEAIQRITKPHGDCRPADSDKGNTDFKYSVKDCYYRCLDKAMLEKCKCIHPFYIRNYQESMICNSSKGIQCVTTYYQTLSDSCVCQQPCM